MTKSDESKLTIKIILEVINYARTNVESRTKPTAEIDSADSRSQRCGRLLDVQRTVGEMAAAIESARISRDQNNSQ